ncbi:MAG: hypothetical protein RLZZ496_711, partial [Pseudomonadota bacterium]
MSMKSAIAVFLAAGVAFGAAGCSQTTGPNESGGTILGAFANLTSNHTARNGAQ